MSLTREKETEIKAQVGSSESVDLALSESGILKNLHDKSSLKPHIN